MAYEGSKGLIDSAVSVLHHHKKNAGLRHNIACYKPREESDDLIVFVVRSCVVEQHIEALAKLTSTRNHRAHSQVEHCARQVSTTAQPIPSDVRQNSNAGDHEPRDFR